MRTIEYYWYDFFNVSLGPWWYDRWGFYWQDLPIADSYPYLYRHYRDKDFQNYTTYSNARLKITGRNMPEINMNERPQFIPLLGKESGGNANVSWHMGYVSGSLLDIPLPTCPIGSDGWWVQFNGSMELDTQAAKAVLNITDEGLGHFDEWWEANNNTFSQSYIQWLMEEAGPDRLDIFPMYNYKLTPLYYRAWAERCEAGVVIHLYHVTWGMEALVTRWLHEAFMPTEWYFEDMDFRAVISPESADIDIDTAVDYAVFASKSRNDESPCWVWEARLQDFLVSSVAHPLSDFDPYADEERVMFSPGSADFGKMVGYSGTPGAQNLSVGETMVVEWPHGALLFLEHDFVTGNSTNHTSPVGLEYCEPSQVDIPAAVGFGADNTIVFEGPLDVWAWSFQQTTHQNLSDEWARIGVLPYGVHYIEMNMIENTPPSASFDASLVSYPYLYELHASSDADAEDALWQLQSRWDFDGDGRWDTPWLSGVGTVHDFGSFGEFLVTAEVIDTCGATDSATLMVTVPEDGNPPVSCCYVDGTLGNNGWHVSSVSVSLSVEDDLSGVLSTMVRTSDEWLEYQEPIVFEDDGIFSLEYYSEDLAGNCEEQRSVEVKADTLGPTVSFVDSEDSYSDDGVRVEWERADITSGINRSVLIIDGEEYLDVGGNKSAILIGLSEGAHHVELRAYDNAGNWNADSLVFTVYHSESRPWLTAVSAATIAGVIVVTCVSAVVFLRWRRGFVS